MYLRTAIYDPSHYDQNIWSMSNLLAIQRETSDRLEKKGIRVTIPIEQIKNVVDSVTEAKPHIDTKGASEMVTAYIVNYIVQEDNINNTPAYDASVTNYDGSFGIQRFSQGQLGIKKKGLNRMGRMY